MYSIDEIRNKVFYGSSIDVLKKFPSNSIDCAITSPPYLWLRNYGTEHQIWDGDPTCNHDFSIDIEAGDLRFRGKNSYIENCSDINIHTDKHAKSSFCRLCSAWKGELGQEPYISLYIKHLCDIFDEVKRALKPTGTCFVNIGDSASQSGGSGHDHIYHTQFGKYIDSGTGQKPHKAYELPPKCECSVPEIFKLEMIRRGWICRRSIIWQKDNCVPQSATDTFTKDYEMIYFFVKSTIDQYWTNRKSLLSINTKPKGINGIEDIDWEWTICPNCSEPNTIGEQTTLFSDDSQDSTENKTECNRCNSTGKVKDSLWISHDYYFEQQFEPICSTTMTRAKGKYLSAKNDTGQYKGITNKNARRYASKILSGRLAGRNKRSVWSIPLKPLHENHYAAYSESLIETPIIAGCPQYICSRCGIPHHKIYVGNIEAGISKCACELDTVNGIVLDPFSGSGSTCIAAKKLGRDFVGIDLSKEYIEIAMNRINRVPMSFDNFF